LSSFVDTLKVEVVETFRWNVWKQGKILGVGVISAFLHYSLKEESFTIMDYWEFLLQKEGDRSWLPIKSPQLNLDVGRYRVVAHSSRANTDVEICVTHTDTKETPPKRRYQKRSRRTNPDGLMVIIPFTYLKPGLWELRCCGDIMSDFLGDSWQETVQLSVVPSRSESLEKAEGKAEEANGKTQVYKVEADITPETVNRDSTPSEKIYPPGMASLDYPETEAVHASEKQRAIADADSSHSVTQPANTPSPSELPSLTEEIPLPHTPISSQTPETTTEPSNGKTGEEEETTETNPIAQSPAALPELEIPEPDIPHQTSAPSSNPILDHSLQVLEQVLQQVLDPVIQEFEASESSELPIPLPPDSEFPAAENTPWQGLTLTLEEEALVAQRGNSLTVAGQVDQFNVHPQEPRQTRPNEMYPFQGILHYELRHPQTGQVVVEVQQPIIAPEFPIAFSQSLEIPSDSKTCLLLGKVNLYDSTKIALASQPFTVTVDLDELLVAVQSGNWTKSEEMTPVVSTPQSKSQSISLNQIFLDLVDQPKSSQPVVYQPSSHQPLPPQLYQPQSQSRLTKSLDLPTFPQPKPTPTPEKDSESVKDIKPETEARSHSLESTEKQTSETTPSASDDRTENVVVDSSVTESVVQTTDDGDNNPDSSVANPTLSDTSMQAETEMDSEEEEPTTPPLEDNLAAVEETSEQELTTPETESDSSPEEEISNSEVSEWKTAAMSSAAPPDQDPIAVDRAFTELNLDDRFWGRLNALMTDTDLAEWLKVELPPSEDLVELEGDVSDADADPLFTQPEESPPSFEEDTALNDFDESIWEEDSEKVGSLNQEEDIPALEPPAQPDHPPVNREELLEREIVVEDDPPATESSASQPTDSRTVEKQRSHLRTADITHLDVETPLPTPELFIPTQELAAGEPVLVRVKLAADSDRLGVKLWVQDRQSRSLLDGPRWLMELSPNKAGELEGLTQLVVPFGTVEIRFEAITVDLDSERESHKISVDRVVVPPDLSDVSDDEF